MFGHTTIEVRSILPSPNTLRSANCAFGSALQGSRNNRLRDLTFNGSQSFSRQMESSTGVGPLTEARTSRVPWFVPLVALVVYLLRHAYGFPAADHDDLLPYLYHLLNPELFAEDWFVASQTAAAGPRTLFVWFTYLPARLLGPAVTYAVLFALSWCFIAAAVYALSHHVSKDKLVAAGTVVAAMLLTPKFTLGGNDLAIAILTPSCPAWALALWGLVLLLRGERALVGLLLGLATCLQALIGMQMAVVSLLLLLWGRERWSALMWFGAAYTLIAVPALLPQVLQHTGSGANSSTIFHILFEFRAPHHYLLSRFDAFRSFSFLALLLASLACLPLLSTKQRRLPVRVLVIAVGFGLAGYVGTELLGSVFVGKLQLFKVFVLAKVFVVTVLCIAIRRVLPEVVARWAGFFFDRERASLLGVLVIAGCLVAFTPQGLGFKAAPVAEEDSALRQFAAWANENSDTDAVFAVPPGWSGFMSHAQRGVVVAIKGFPFADADMLEWYERLQALAPGVGAEGPLGARMEQMDSAFLDLDWQRMAELSVRYRFSYVVRPAEAQNDAPSRAVRVAEAEGFVLYLLLTSAE